jgi:hypothetical protein
MLQRLVSMAAAIVLGGCGAPEPPPALPVPPADSPGAPVPWASAPEPDFAKPSLPDRDGAPLLLVAPADRPWARHLAELLRTAGFTTFDVADDASSPTARLVLVGRDAADDGSLDLLRAAAERGADVILVQPRGALAQLAGVELTGTHEGGVLIRSGRLPMQIHGQNLIYRTFDAQRVAGIRESPHGFYQGPAVTIRRIDGGGRVVAFAFDPAEAVVQARQGNPAWADTNRDGYHRFRSTDLFFGGADRPPGAGSERAPDHVDWDLASAPQADELLRLLTDLLVPDDGAIPLPRVDLLPFSHRAAVLMTGDDHGAGGTVGRFARFDALSPPGCVGERWQCVRGSSYVDPGVQLDPADVGRWTEQGFEIGLHTSFDAVQDGASYAALAKAQWAALQAAIPDLAPPVSRRNHGAATSGWAIQPKVHSTTGIQLDVNGYFWPPSWLVGRPPYPGGTLLPMRFADVDGQTIDSFGIPTVWTDETGQAYPDAAAPMMDAALSPDGWPGIFTTNFHTDRPDSPEAEAVIQAAQQRGIPVISGRQLMAWWLAREAIEVAELAWDGTRLEFDVSADPELGATLVLPGHRAARGLHLRHEGREVPAEVSMERGLSVARFPARPGRWTATWDGAAPSSASPVCTPWSGLPNTLLELTNLRVDTTGAVQSEPGALGHPEATKDLTTAAWGRGGVSRSAGGAWVLDRAWLAEPEPVQAPATLRSRVRFGAAPFQTVGLAQQLGSEPMAIVTTGADGEASAQTRGADGTTLRDVLPLPLDVEVDLRIEWTAEKVVYSVDGSIAVEHAVSPPGPLWALASDYQLGASLLHVVSLATSPAAVGPGLVRSGPLPRADALTWSAPTGTTVEVDVESADTPNRWLDLDAPGPVQISAPLMRLRAVIHGPGPVLFEGTCSP